MVDTEKLAQTFIRIMFEEAGKEGVSVEDIEDITTEMISRMKNVKMILDKTDDMEAECEEAEKVQRNVRGCENERAENGTDSDNGQSDGGKTGISDVREKENQSNISESNQGRWQDKMLCRFLRVH